MVEDVVAIAGRDVVRIIARRRIDGEVFDAGIVHRPAAIGGAARIGRGAGDGEADGPGDAPAVDHQPVGSRAAVGGVGAAADDDQRVVAAQAVEGLFARAVLKRVRGPASVQGRVPGPDVGQLFDIGGKRIGEQIRAYFVEAFVRILDHRARSSRHVEDVVARAACHGSGVIEYVVAVTAVGRGRAMNDVVAVLAVYGDAGGRTGFPEDLVVAGAGRDDIGLPLSG